MPIKVGSFVQVGGGNGVTQTVNSGLGEAPDAMIFFTVGNTAENVVGNHAKQSVGFWAGPGVNTAAQSSHAVSSTHGSASSDSTRGFGHNAFVGRSSANATPEQNAGYVSAVNANGTFVVTWPINDNSPRIWNFVAISGPDVEAKVVEFMWPNAANAAFDVTSIGFQPEALLMIGGQTNVNPDVADAHALQFFGMCDADLNQICCTEIAEDAQATMDTYSGIFNNEFYVRSSLNGVINARATITAILSNGFRANCTGAGAQGAAAVLAIRGLDAQVKAHGPKPLVITPPGAAAVTTTTFDFEPDAVIGRRTVHPFFTSALSGNLSSAMGAFDGVTARSVAWSDRDNVADAAVFNRTSGGALFTSSNVDTGNEGTRATPVLDGTDLELTWNPNTNANPFDMAVLALADADTASADEFAKVGGVFVPAAVKTKVGGVFV